MPYRNKVFVSFDGDNDMHYYRLMLAWKQSDHTSFTFHNAHDLNTARDSSLEESIKRQLSIRLQNTKVFVSLVGQNTRFLYKFVRWEIEQAVRLNIPIVAVNLNGFRTLDLERCPPLLRDASALHVSFNPKVLEHALDMWPDYLSQIPAEARYPWYAFEPSVYVRLGVH